ncbi:hypothetical protein BD560DRAFT_425540 [Blakeslea trispora]|nr:hypothetical protein BD560DRAFT_425540 [Blakeslea trispora]
MTSRSINSLVAALDHGNMENKKHYKNVVLLSQRIQVQLDLMKTYRQCSHASRHIPESSCLSQDILSPTETIISYYTSHDTHHTKEAFYYSDDGSMSSSQTELLIDDYSRRSSEATAIEKRRTQNRPEKKSRLYQTTCYNPAIELSASSSKKTLVSTKTPSSLSFYQTTKSAKEPKILDTLEVKHIKKKYHLKSLLNRTYYLDNIMVKRNLTLPHLYASKDILTGEKNAVLKLIVAYRYDRNNSFVDRDTFLIAYSASDLLNELNSHQRRQHVSLLPGKAEDHKLKNAVAAWIQCQHVLPSLASIRHFFRDGMKVYIVMNLSQIMAA